MKRPNRSTAHTSATKVAAVSIATWSVVLSYATLSSGKRLTSVTRQPTAAARATARRAPDPTTAAGAISAKYRRGGRSRQALGFAWRFAIHVRKRTREGQLVEPTGSPRPFWG